MALFQLPEDFPLPPGTPDHRGEENRLFVLLHEFDGLLQISQL